MKVLFLTHRADTPSTRYRVTMMLPGLRARGWEAERRDFPSGLSGWMSLLRISGRYEVLVVQKRLPAVPAIRALRACVRRLVYDFDDAVHLGRRGSSPTRRRRFRAMVRAADLVLAGNEWLGRRAREAGAGRVEILPTGLDPGAYPLHEHGEGAVAGWIGGGGNLPYLETLIPALEEAARRDSRLRLRVISDRFPAGAALPVERCPWSEATEGRDLAGVDIGLAPLPDDEWARGKCGFRILQYQAVGVPVVASPVGVQAELVQEGRTGRLAGTPREWTEAVLALAADREGRRRMGLEGRRQVERSYSVASLSGRLSELLEAVAR